jgi:hypothetical protein
VGRRGAACGGEAEAAVGGSGFRRAGHDCGRQDNGAGKGGRTGRRCAKCA